MSPTVELVLARYNEDAAWAEELGVPVTIYNKGAGCLFNVGREAGTYLTHILARWDNLADWTVFCQADPFPHLKGIDLRTMLKPRDAFRVPWRCRVREWGEDGRLCWRGEWKERAESGEIARADLSIVDWFRLHLGVDLNARGAITYHPGAIFGVHKSRVLAQPRAFYERLLATVSQHVHPEEAHYLERAWPLIFTDGKGW